MRWPGNNRNERALTQRRGEFAQRFQLGQRAAGIDLRIRPRAAGGEILREAAHHERGGGVQDDYVAHRSAELAAQDAGENLRIARAVAAAELLDARELDAEIGGM